MFKKTEPNSKDIQYVTLMLDEHKISFDELCARYETDLIKGLTDEKAAENLRKYGPNVCSPPKEPRPICRYFRNMYQGLAGVAWIGVLVCIITYSIESLANLVEEPNIDHIYLAISVCCFIHINGGVSFYVEGLCLKFVRSVKHRLKETKTVVIRDGRRRRIDVKYLTVGDLLEVKAGDQIPADIRVIKCDNFKVDNFIFTHISDPVAIKPMLTNGTPYLPDNIIFASTFALEGICYGIVINTGDKTVIGQISKKSKNLKDIQSILSKSVTRIIMLYSLVGLCLSMLFGIMYMRMHCTWIQTTLVFVAVYVACVPEQLLLALKLCQLRAGQIMLHSSCLPKNFHAIEALGSIFYICTGKTGFMSERKMSAASIWTGENVIPAKGMELKNEEYQAFLRCVTLCGRPDNWKRDNPDTSSDNLTEFTVPSRPRLTAPESLQFALSQFANWHSDGSDDWRASEFEWEIPFCADRKYYVAGYRVKGHSRQCVVMMGDPVVVFRHCSAIHLRSKNMPIFNEVKLQMQEACDEMALNGGRIFGFADYFRDSKVDEDVFQTMGHKFRFLGLLSMTETPKASIPNAISQCQSGFLKVILITRGSPATAKAFARKVGLITNEKSALVVTGEQLHNMSNEVLDGLIKNTREIVFANTTPRHKFLIVKSCQRLGGRVAVTGDDAKDCRALRAANIGIAMSDGLDIVKQAADVILQDNSFPSILKGIESGRLAYENFQKCVMCRLASIVPQLVPFFLFLFAEIPRPLGAFSILIITIATELMPVLALAYEKPEFDMLKKRPVDLKHKNFLEARVMRREYLIIGPLEAMAGLFAYYIVFADNGFVLPLTNSATEWDSTGIIMVDAYGQDWNYSQRKELEYSAHTAFCFAVIVTQIVNAITCKTRQKSVFQQGMRNWHFNAAIAFALLLGITVSVLPPGHLEKAIRQRRIRFDWFLPSLPFMVFIFCFQELRRLMVRNYPNGWMSEEFNY